MRWMICLWLYGSIAMAWIYDPSGGPLNEEQAKNNADIIINYYRSINMADETIAGILGNIENESGFNPMRVEAGGGGGYGLVQWTPQSVLINHCDILGLSPYTDGDNQLKCIVAEVQGNPSSVREWYTTAGFIENYYPSGATDDMIGITGVEFLQNTMGWTADKMALMFMVGYERPAYDPNVNHIDRRKADALKWYEYMGGVIPPTPTTKHYKVQLPIILLKRRFML